MALTRDFKKTVVAQVERDPSSVDHWAGTLGAVRKRLNAGIRAHTVALRKVA
jgi:hypothetical protein